MTNPQHVNTEKINQLLSGVATGQLSVADAMASLMKPPDDQKTPRHLDLDLDRQRRCGFPEVIYGEGKPASLIAEIIVAQQAAGQPSLATRLDAATAAELLNLKSIAPLSLRYNSVARTVHVAVEGRSPIPTELPRVKAEETAPEKTPPHVAVITAGSTDAFVAEEAIETLHWMGVPHRRFEDIGVAGPARLLRAVPELRQAATVIVIAGMEGALPAAVGGHLDVPVFAVPTSVGYGATLGGLTPLMGMLSCCASNVAVVNIDAGFKAAYLAGLVACPRKSTMM